MVLGQSGKMIQFCLSMLAVSTKEPTPAAIIASAFSGETQFKLAVATANSNKLTYFNMLCLRS